MQEVSQVFIISGWVDCAEAALWYPVHQYAFLSHDSDNSHLWSYKGRKSLADFLYLYWAYGLYECKMLAFDIIEGGGGSSGLFAHGLYKCYSGIIWQIITASELVFKDQTVPFLS